MSSKPRICPTILMITAVMRSFAAAQQAPQLSVPPWISTNTIRTVVEASAVHLGLYDYASVSLSGLSLLAARRWDNTFDAGVALGYVRLAPDGSFGSLSVVRWSPVHDVAVALPLSLVSSGSRTRVAPSICWSGEDGADWSDASTVGLVLSHRWQFEAGHEVGFGTVMTHGLGRTRLIPFPYLWWNLSDRWQLGNPAPAGPATPAGVELRWRATVRWSFGMGTSYRNDRYLRSDERVAEWRWVPIWVRVSWRSGPLGLTGWAGSAVARRIDLRDTDGNVLNSTQLSPAPLLGLSLLFRL